MKLEVQLREQTRQIDQDKWKMTQDDNRLKAMQVKSSFGAVSDCAENAL